MKHTLSILLAALAAAFTAFADDYEPKTSWPYAYDEFLQGSYTDNVGASSEGLFNVNLINGRLHFIRDGYINEALPGAAFAVQIGGDYYVNVRFRMMKVLARNDRGCVVLDREVDQVALNSTGGAYGSSSSTLGTRALSSVDGVAGSNYVGMTHMAIRAAKTGGQTLPLIEKMYVVAGGRVMYATRKDLGEEVGDSGLVKSFLKEHKIKWKEPQSLLEVVDFLASLPEE